uniref:Uncharacterized protein n=1 Tax=Oryza brachyantha TaxID=4533 RepID=J3LNF8_ORYBR
WISLWAVDFGFGFDSSELRIWGFGSGHVALVLNFRLVRNLAVLSQCGQCLGLIAELKDLK